MTDRTRKWTSEDRTAAFEAYFRTGSRAQVRRELGIPERTLASWLGDDRFADQREAVQAGLIMAVQAEAVRRGQDLAEATSEAILVCRKALRRDPDGKTASSLLGGLMRAREVEDRIQRLDQGEPTEIAGVTVAPEDREAFAEWHDQHLEAKTLGRDELMRRLHERFVAAIGEALQPLNGQLLHDALARIAHAGPSPVVAALRGDAALAHALLAILQRVVEQAASDDETGEAASARSAAPRPGSEHDPSAPVRTMSPVDPRSPAGAPNWSSPQSSSAPSGGDSDVR